VLSGIWSLSAITTVSSVADAVTDAVADAVGVKDDTFSY
jgi:hypothetical protein